MTKRRSPQLTKAIFITMLVSVAGTMVYRATPFAKSFDPAVFGVLLSIVVFVICRLFFVNKG
jgi:hypothetical protein